MLKRQERPSHSPETRLKRRQPRHIRKSGTKQVGALTIASLVSYGAGTLTGPLLAHALSTDGRGEVAATLTPFAVMIAICVFGLDASGAYFVRTKSREEVLQASWVWALSVVVPLCLLGWFLAVPFFSGRPSAVTWSFRGLLLLLPFIVVIQIAAEVELNLNGVSWRLIVVQFGPLIFNALGVVILAISRHLTVTSALVSAFSSQLISVVLGVVLLNIHVPRGQNSHTTVPMFKYGALGAVGTISFVLVGRLDQIMMVKLVASSALGLYAVAANVMVVNAAGSMALCRWGFGKVRTSPNPFQMVNKLLRAAAVQSIVLAVAAAVVSPFALPILFGRDFAGAVTLVYLLLPGQVCIDIAAVFCASLSAMGHPGYSSLSRLTGAVLSAGALYPAIVRYGARGASVVTSCSGLLVLISSVTFYQWVVRSKEEWKTESSADSIGIEFNP